MGREGGGGVLLNSPIDQPNDAPEHAEGDGTAHIPLLRLGLLCDTHSLTDHIDQRHYQAPKADTPERVRQRPSCSTPCRTSGHTPRLARAEEPRPVDAGDDGVDSVLEPLGDPIASERDEDDEPDDFRAGATGTAGAGGVGATARGFIFDVDADERYGEPGAESEGADAADGGDEEDVAEAAGDIHGLLKHYDGEGDAWDPAHLPRTEISLVPNHSEKRGTRGKGRRDSRNK